MKKTLQILALIVLFFSFAKTINAESGCCSWHGGVCNFSCCDGTPLSNECLFNSSSSNSEFKCSSYISLYSNYSINSVTKNLVLNAIEDAKKDLDENIARLKKDKESRLASLEADYQKKLTKTETTNANATATWKAKLIKLGVKTSGASFSNAMAGQYTRNQEALQVIKNDYISKKNIIISDFDIQISSVETCKAQLNIITKSSFESSSIKSNNNIYCTENATLNTDNKCYCNNGYVASFDKKTCEKSVCPINSTISNGECLCNDGYVFKNNSCITHDKDCQNIYGEYTYGNKEYCYCINGYQWNTNKTACIKIEFKQIKLNAKSDDVKKLQTKLKSKKFFSANATGFFGQQTQTAVKNFQKKNKLKVTGIVDETTWNLIIK